MPNSLPSTNILIRRLDSIFALDHTQRTAINGIPIQTAELRADQDVVREGDRPTRCCILLEGFTCWFKDTGDGRRQILSFHVPGDIPDLQSLHLDMLDSTLGTISPCRVGFVQHEAVREVCERHPNIASALWRTTLIDASVFREWVLNVGSRPAYGRIAHLLCELIVRLGAVGLADELSCEFPITQSDLAFATGLSTVHVNRTVQELRANGLIALKTTRLQVLDWEGLKAAGDFDEAYLHLRSRAKGL